MISNAIPSKNNRIHAFLKCTQNIHQDSHILGHTSSLGNFKKIEIISNIFYDFNAIRLHTNYRGKYIKPMNAWRLNNMFLNDQEVKEEIKQEIKIR